MDDLLKLESCKPAAGNTNTSRGKNSAMMGTMGSSPIRDHPDQRFHLFLVRGIREGFRVGFDYSRLCRAASRNMGSAQEKPQIVQEYLQKEVTEGRILGPFDPAEYPQIHTSRFGVIPKSIPGKWRLIVDMSSTEGNSVNDGIHEPLCSLSYVTVMDGARRVASFGRGALMAKVDIRNAYIVIPVHPDDRWLMGMLWWKNLYIDTAFPFGLRSAPKLFSALADAMEWIAKNNGISFIIHYLDDFLLLGHPHSQQCAESVAKLVSILDQLRMSVAWDKLEGQAPKLMFLGFRNWTPSSGKFAFHSVS